MSALQTLFNQYDYSGKPSSAQQNRFRAGGGGSIKATNTVPVLCIKISL